MDLNDRLYVVEAHTPNLFLLALFLLPFLEDIDKAWGVSGVLLVFILAFFGCWILDRSAYHSVRRSNQVAALEKRGFKDIQKEAFTFSALDKSDQRINFYLLEDKHPSAKYRGTDTFYIMHAPIKK